MASARQKQSQRKSGNEPAAQRRPQAWGSAARASPTFQPAASPSTRQQHSASPAPPQPNGANKHDPPRDRTLQALSGLTGTTITLLTKTAQRYEAVIASTTAEGDTTGVTLKDVKDISNPGAPLKDSLFIASTNIDSYTSGPADAAPPNGDSFRTDADISQKKGLGRERELQAWMPSAEPHPSASTAIAADEDTFGATAANGATNWDQFTVNEKLFGVKASFDEDAYTTKLDRSAPDFKERERKAQKIANEITGLATNNPHIAEERGIAVDDSGVNEEDKYGAVVRGQNAYVPPGARKSTSATPAATTPAADNATKVDVPKVSVNGPDGTPAKGASPAPAPKPPADAVPAFRDFVTNEKQRLTQKRQALVKSDMDKRMAELVKFSQSFKLNKPIPEDLVPILAKDEDKQRLIKEKAQKDAASGQARAIGASTPATASRGVAVAGAKIVKPAPAPSAVKAGAVANAIPAALPPSSKAAPTAAKPADGKSATAPKKIPMVIQSIPPFRGGKGKTPTASGSATPAPGNSNGSTPVTNGANANRTSATASPAAGAPVSPNTAGANRLNVNASSFRPNPKAVASPKPAPAVAVNAVSPKPKQESAPGPPNPFFGARPIKKSTPVHIKDDFNPFKHNKVVVDASQVAAMWPYSGKRYIQMFPPLQHPPVQPPTHMVPPVPPPIPPPSYEEDSAAQAAAARGYVYAPYPYAYPPPHMMQGMPPPGPPGAYMPGPYMQAMPYPPGMPPPNAMYSPAMGQMPPPGTYMPQPPPGAYPPPPPNGAGPRPSMPPTPIPAHAHPYYHHQSPQLQHAYPMMMPPPPNMPPHGYEGGPAPPVQMGGHA